MAKKGAGGKESVVVPAQMEEAQQGPPRKRNPCPGIRAVGGQIRRNSDEQQRREDEEHDGGGGGERQQQAKAALTSSAMCVRISRDSYPNLHALHNASNDSLTNAAYVKISEGDFGYVLDDVPHLADYLPVSSHPSPPLLLLARPLVGSWRWVLCGAALAKQLSVRAK